MRRARHPGAGRRDRAGPRDHRPGTVTLYEVGTIKDVEVVDGYGHPQVRVSVDGGMSDNVRPALYGADYSVRIANRVSDADPALVRIAGKHCE